MDNQVDHEALVVQLRSAFLQQNLEPYDSRDVSRMRNDDRAVLSYLKNCHYNLEKAFNMMSESLKWRKSFQVNDISKDSFSPEILNDPYLYFKGYGKKGEPLLIWDTRRHKKGNVSLNAEMKKFLAYLLEYREGAKDYQKVVMLFNMSGCGLSNIDYDFIKYLISLLTEYYPDILDNLLVFEMPRLLSAAWTIIKNMLDEDSRDAIRFVNKTDVLEFVDKDQLPVSLGGTNEAAITNVMDNEFQSIADKKQVTFTQQTPLSPTTPSESRSRSTSADKMSLLQITPQDTITFTVQQSNSESQPQMIRMTNTRETAVAYKVKTTAPEHYRVKPTVGIIEPGQWMEVSVQLTPGSAVTASRDRFLVQSTLITSPIKGDITEYWRGVEGGKVNEHRLRCKVSLNGSPIEDKVDMLNSVLNGTCSAPPNMNERLQGLDNKLKLILESQQSTQRQVKIILSIIQIFVLVTLFYTGYLLYQEYLLLQDTPPDTQTNTRTGL